MAQTPGKADPVNALYCGYCRELVVFQTLGGSPGSDSAPGLLRGSCFLPGH
ncbi:MAG: hypothetical protein HFH94_01850 [Lachnospiraceae bacterium]|nr:hypothetical protein [uncultured Acetatifactor sp.]MCI9218477.1 hypothetical protein [Lachnospiraceae bacterium]